MEVAQQGRRSRPAGKGRFTEALVLASMALLTIALGTAAHLHGGFDVWTAIMTSFTIYVCLIAFHSALRGRRAVDAMRSKISDLESELERLGQSADGDARPAPSRFTARPAGPPQQFKRRGDTGRGDAGRPELGEFDPPLPGFASPEARKEPPRAETRPEPRASRGVGRDFLAPPPPPLSADLAAPPPVHSSAQPVDPAKQRVAAHVEDEEPAPAPALRVREGDIEMLQAMIKKLADEVNAAEAAGTGHGLEGLERATGRSVDALKSAAGSMRAADRSVRGDARREAASPQSRHPETRLQSIKDALLAGRVDVLLEPILTLKDRKPRHFEVSLRLKDESGAVLDVEGCERTEAGRAILPIIDRVNVERTAQVALRLECRGRQGALFSGISGESLTADKFLDGVANAYRARESFAGQLVMTFTQADVRAFGERERATLADLADLGFRYAISSVTDLEMDFAELKEAGFDFVKLDAEVFLDGLMTGETRIPARDVCRYLADMGLTLIVGRIDDEQLAARVFGFGVLFGQGQMFGGPRPVKRGALEAGKDHLAA